MKYSNKFKFNWLWFFLRIKNFTKRNINKEYSNWYWWWQFKFFKENYNFALVSCRDNTEFREVLEKISNKLLHSKIDFDDQSIYCVIQFNFFSHPLLFEYVI